MTNEATEPWYWTGATDTKPCGCVFDELAATDGHCELDDELTISLLTFES
jgi:hypothetical protein